jgi:hypothetical protein
VSYVAVVSHDRIDTANRQTLRLLADRGVPADAVVVFVAEGEVDAYRAGLDVGLYGELAVGGDSLMAQRHAVVAYFDEGAHVVCCDDDLGDVVERLNEKQTAPVADLPAVFDRGFKACEMAGSSLWGIGPVLNPMFMKPSTSSTLAFCIGHLFGVVNTHAEWARFDLAPKADYHQTLVRYEHDGAVARLNDVAAKSKMLAPGGLASRMADRRTANRDAVRELVRRWPRWVSVAKRRSATGLEVRLRDGGTGPR